MNVKTYRELDVWKKGMMIVSVVYRMTKSFPAEERYILASQMVRAAISIPSNIAEGSRRQYLKEFVQHCHIALGSAAELETQILIAHGNGLVSHEAKDRIMEALDHESRMLTNLIRAVRKAKGGA